MIKGKSHLLQKTAVIYRKGVVLYGDDGEYKLLAKHDDSITYLFTPWDARTIYDTDLQKMEIRNLSNLLKVNIIWAAW